MHQQTVAKKYGKKSFQEIRTVKGEEYHPSTPYNNAMMIQIYINERVDKTLKILEDNDFHDFRKSLDQKMKNLTSSGHLTAPRQAGIITEQMEQELWGKIFQDGKNQKKLLRIVYFLVGKHFALRSRREHHYFRHGMGSQIKIDGNGPNKKIIHQEDLSENNNRGLKHVKYKGKTGTIFSTGRSHCAVEIIEKYLKKISPKSKFF